MKVQYTPHQNADIRPIAPQRMPRRPSVKRFLGTAAAGAATSIDAADAAADEEIAWSMSNPISEVPNTGYEKLNADAARLQPNSAYPANMSRSSLSDGRGRKIGRASCRERVCQYV